MRSPFPLQTGQLLRRSASDGLGALRKALRTPDEVLPPSLSGHTLRSAASEEARDRELLLAYLRQRFPHATGCLVCTVPDHNPPHTEPTPATSTGWGGAWVNGQSRALRPEHSVLLFRVFCGSFCSAVLLVAFTSCFHSRRSLACDGATLPWASWAAWSPAATEATDVLDSRRGGREHPPGGAAPAAVVRFAVQTPGTRAALLVTFRLSV